MKEFGYDKQYDVIVAGGGVSGTVAAIAAGRLGADVLILEEGAYLGGALTGCGVGPMMTFHAGEKQVIRGIMEEIVERLKTDGLKRQKTATRARKRGNSPKAEQLSRNGSSADSRETAPWAPNHNVPFFEEEF